jgi:chromosome partitioning protein
MQFAVGLSVLETHGRPEGGTEADEADASKRIRLQRPASFEGIMASALHMPSRRRIMSPHMDESPIGMPKMRRRKATIADLLELAGRAKEVLMKAREDASKPDGKKLRDFTMSEVCALLEIHFTKFYEAVADHPELQGTKVKGKRLFTLANIHALQEHLKQLPHQKYGIERALTISVANFKGGVAKTFTAVTLAQYLAMRGFRTLMIDTDPQASLTSCFGLDSSQVEDHHTILPYLYGRERVELYGHDWPETLSSCIQPTYWSRLDIVAANLALYSGEFALGLRREESKGTDAPFHFHRPLNDAIESIRSKYDVIIIDNPPALSLSTTGAIFAADGLILPTAADNLDFESAEAFMQLAGEILQAVNKSFGDEKELDLFRILITKFQGRDAEQKIARRIREVFGEYCIEEPMVQTSVVQKSGAAYKTLYEEDPRGKGRSVLKRAVEAANTVNKLIEDDIIDVFVERQREQNKARQVAA